MEKKCHCGSILELNSKFKNCEKCRKIDKLCDKTHRANINEINKKAVEEDSNFRACFKCPRKEGIIMHPLEDMGIDKRGNRSNKCKHHFEQQQKNESRRKRNLIK